MRKPVHTVGQDSVLYKLLTIGKQLPTFTHRVQFELQTSEVGGQCVTTVAPSHP